jgi:hypothetical protein
MTGETRTDPGAHGPGGNGGTSGDPAHMREMRLQRNLKILVTGLGLAIFLGLGAVAWKMMALAKERRAASGEAISAIAPLTGTNDIALELPKGAQVVSTSISGNRLAVHYVGPTGTGIAIIDLETGKRIADVKAREALPRE